MREFILNFFEEMQKLIGPKKKALPPIAAFLDNGATTYSQQRCAELVEREYSERWCVPADERADEQQRLEALGLMGEVEIDIPEHVINSAIARIKHPTKTDEFGGAE